MSMTIKRIYRKLKNILRNTISPPKRSRNYPLFPKIMPDYPCDHPSARAMKAGLGWEMRHFQIFYDDFLSFLRHIRFFNCTQAIALQSKDIPMITSGFIRQETGTDISADVEFIISGYVFEMHGDQLMDRVMKELVDTHGLAYILFPPNLSSIMCWVCGGIGEDGCECRRRHALLY